MHKSLSELVEHGYGDTINVRAVLHRGLFHASAGDVTFGTWCTLGRGRDCAITARAQKVALPAPELLCSRCVSQVRLNGSRTSLEDVVTVHDTFTRVEQWVGSNGGPRYWDQAASMTSSLEALTYVGMPFFKQRWRKAVVDVKARRADLDLSDRDQLLSWCASDGGGTWVLAQVKEYAAARSTLLGAALACYGVGSSHVHAPKAVVQALGRFTLQAAPLGKGQAGVAEAAAVLSAEGLGVGAAVKVARAL